VRAEKAEGINTRGKSPPLSSNPTNNDNRKDKIALLALSNAAMMTIYVCCLSQEMAWGQ
jgi:hypothetical protein